MLAHEYQLATRETEIYSGAATNFVVRIQDGNYSGTDKWLRLAYCAGKLNGEAGEVAEHIFKAFRDDSGILTAERQDALKKELGDVAWYLARLADELGFDLEDIFQDNINKLMDRKERGVISGSGDSR